MATMADQAEQLVYRQLQPRWNTALIAASCAVSLLGAFTATQLMCHARMSLNFSTVFIWTMLGSVIFAYCSVWSLHEVAMLACEFDVPIGVDAPLTILSSILAVSFTFAALAGDLLVDRWRGQLRRRKRKAKKAKAKQALLSQAQSTQCSQPLLQMRQYDPNDDDDDDDDEEGDQRAISPGTQPKPPPKFPVHIEVEDGVSDSSSRSDRAANGNAHHVPPSSISEDNATGTTESAFDASESQTTRTSSDWSSLRRGSSSSGGLSSVMGIVYRRGTQTTANAFIATAQALRAGCTGKNILKAFLWSLAVTSMHYVGILGLKIPQGYFILNLWLVALSALISWAVCLVGCILMAEMETQLYHQLLFSLVATLGVAAMHFTGMRAVTFYSAAPPSDIRGYPPILSSAVVGIAFATCILANLLLAQSATVSRNKLAEIVLTRRELWKTIAQKENAEAAALARSEFIASASHEIRTPLHHLQGYSDLLSQTKLTTEGRELLVAIQRATKTLSLITNNVLDWSKLERDSEAAYRPTALDIRSVCESIIVLLPNMDEETKLDVYVVVSPEVPSTLFLDETFIHRIFMNLLSNSLKFTRSGYILLSVQMKDDNLIATIKDTGCGLDPSFLPEMWTPYKQGEIRGSARGTGLGLSIIKQLLQRMDGTIDVESEFEHSEDVGPAKSGTTFTLTIPIKSTMVESRAPAVAPKPRPQVAILAEDEESRAFEGLCRSWDMFGYDTIKTNSIADMERVDVKLVWADLAQLERRPLLFEALLKKTSLRILVPYDSHDSLEGLPGIVQASHFIMLQKPLLWHCFDKKIAARQSRSATNSLPRTLRFANEVEVINHETKEVHSETIAMKVSVILLVEDNPINQKLGKKMLLALGYQVLTANDGQDAVDLVRKHDATIDLILMDQSMPRKDGVTATTEIRNLEANGELLKRTPIIAVTAVVNPQAQAQFKLAGADDFLAKPLALGKLKDTLAAHLALT